MYRSNDEEFGLQKNPEMLVYAGIETKNVENYVSAVRSITNVEDLIPVQSKTAVAIPRYR